MIAGRQHRWILITLVTTFLIPPALVMAIDVIAGIFDTKVLIQLVTSWPLYVFVLPFVLAQGIIIGSIKRMNVLVRERQFSAVKKWRKFIVWFYIIVIFLYGTVSWPIGYFHGFDLKQNVLAVMVSIAYSPAANIPLIIIFTSLLDQTLSEVPAKYIKFTSIKFKTLMTNISLTVGGILLLIVSIYSLLWRFTEFPALGYTFESVLQRLTLVSVIVGFFQVLPGIITNHSYTKDIRKINDSVQSISEKNLTGEVKIFSRDEFGEITLNLEKLKEDFRSVMGVIKNNTSTIHGSSLELKKMSMELSDTSNTQAANSEEVAASVEETTASISIALENAEKSVEMSTSTQESVQGGQELIVNTQKNVKNITENIELIQELADQTNLLAINAFIEAANAGEHGKGFAVIAKEIRALADKSKSSAESISRMALQCMENSSASVDKSTEMMDYIFKTAEISKVVNNSSKEQYISIEQINQTIQSFNRSSQILANSSEELSGTSGTLVDSANDLDQLLETFKI